MTKNLARRAAALAAGLVLCFAVASPLLAAPRNQIKVFFLNMGVQSQAQGKILYVTNRAQSFYMIKVSRMDPGTYDVVVNGAIVDTLSVNGDGEGRVMHRSRVNARHNDPPLPYDPRSAIVEIQATGSAVLMATVPSDAATAQAKTFIQFDLTNMGAQTGATASATLTGRFGRFQFEVEMDGAVPGDYDLTVNGAVMGTITVGLNGSGQVRFDSRPSTDDDGDDSLDLMLTFDPRGKAIGISQGGSAVFEGSFPLL